MDLPWIHAPRAHVQHENLHCLHPGKEAGWAGEDSAQCWYGAFSAFLCVWESWGRWLCVLWWFLAELPEGQDLQRLCLLDAAEMGRIGLGRLAATHSFASGPC